MKKRMVIKIVGILFVLGCMGLCVTGCRKNNHSGEKLSIVTTIFPEYDWMRSILGEDLSGVNLTLLLGNGVDLHSYQPSIKDVATISTADIFVYVGGESDTWVDAALKNAVNKDMKIISLMEVLGERVKAEELKEGMQEEEHHEHEDSHEDEDEEEELDEHVWLSLSNAKLICEVMTEALAEKNPSQAEVYRANFASYSAELEALDGRYRKAVQEGEKNTLLFGDRFPFRYLVDDYQLDYFAAFAGCSAESEASFETIIFLANKMDELSLNSIIKIDTGDGKLARTVVASSQRKDAEILTLDSMQSVTLDRAQKGTTYLSLMEENLTVLRQALR